MFVDSLGQVVSSLSQRTIAMFLVNSAFSTYTPSYNAGVNLWSQFGVFNLSEVSLVAEPGTHASLIITSSSFDYSLELVP